MWPWDLRSCADIPSAASAGLGPAAASAVAAAAAGSSLGDSAAGGAGWVAVDSAAGSGVEGDSGAAVGWTSSIGAAADAPASVAVADGPPSVADSVAAIESPPATSCFTEAGTSTAATVGSAVLAASLGAATGGAGAGGCADAMISASRWSSAPDSTAWIWCFSALFAEATESGRAADERRASLGPGLHPSEYALVLLLVFGNAGLELIDALRVEHLRQLDRRRDLCRHSLGSQSRQLVSASNTTAEKLR